MNEVSNVNMTPEEASEIIKNLVLTATVGRGNGKSTLGLKIGMALDLAVEALQIMNKTPVILEKTARSASIDGYIYSLLSNDKKSTIRVSNSLTLIIDWAKNNGYNITNVKEFLNSEYGCLNSST